MEQFLFLIDFEQVFLRIFSLPTPYQLLVWNIAFRTKQGDGTEENPLKDFYEYCLILKRVIFL